MKPEKKIKNVKAKSGKIPKKKDNSTLIIGIFAVILLAGIAYAVFSGESTPKKTGSEIKLPSYAYTNPLTLKAYRYATEHPEMLEQIPCYCGCGGHSGHRFLRDCFIHDDWTYDDHASFCDVCIGEAIKVQDYLAQGKTLKEARLLIDEEYSKKGGDRTNTPPVRDSYTPILSPKMAGIPTATTVQTAKTQTTDLSSLSLPDNFKSLSDGLKLIPPGVRWAYFANLKQETGIEQRAVPDINFYGVPIIGMLNSEYNDGSWVELHDVGKTINVQANNQPNADNIVYTRPYVFDTKDKTNSVLALFKDSATNANAYNSFKSVLDKVDDKNAGFAKINTNAPSFADLSYFGLVRSGNDIKGEIAFRAKDDGTIPLTKYYELKNSSVSRGFKSYDVQKENNTLIIRMTSDLDNVIKEAVQNYGIEI
jgi:hypothetical protein